MITKEQREKDRAICEAATPGPWEHLGGRMVRCRPGGDTVPMRTTEDARFAVRSREALPAYIADAEEMERRIARLDSMANNLAVMAQREEPVAAAGAHLGAAVLEEALRILRGEL